MELELGLKITRTREDVSSSVDFRFSKDPFGPLVLSRETDSRFIIIIHLKGFKKEGIEIDINEEGNRITIKGRKPVEEMVMIKWMAWRKEVEFRVFKKVFRIPDTVDLDMIKASFDDDDATLTITMPKRVKGISGFKIEEEEEERVKFGDVSEVEHKEETEKGEFEEESIERQESDVHSEKFETEFQKEGELADSNKESEDSNLREPPDIEGRGSHEQTRHKEQENNLPLVQAEGESDEFGSKALEEIEEQEPDEQLDRTSESGATKKKTTNDDGDGLRKVPGIEKWERRNDERKIPEMVEGETGGHEKKKVVKMEIKNRDVKEEVDRKMGEGFRPNIDRPQVVGEDYIGENETKAEEFESDKQEADEVDKIHELVDKNEEEGEKAKVRRQSECRNLIKLQENEEQLSKGQKRHSKEERMKELVEEKIPEAETNTRNDILKPCQEIEVPEVDTLGKTGDEGKEKQNTVKEEMKNGDAKEEIDAKMGEISASKTAMKSEDFESDILESDEIDKNKIQKLVEKKDNQEENDKVGVQSEDSSITERLENGEQQIQGQKRHGKQEKIRELVDEQIPEAETNIGNDVLKPVQERSEDKHNIQELFQEKTKNQPEKYKGKIMETGKNTNDAGTRKVQEIIRQQDLDEPARSGKESKTRELVKSKTNAEEKEEKEIAGTAKKELESDRPKILAEKIQELTEEKTKFSKNGKDKSDKEIAEKKTEFGDDDDISKKVRNVEQEESDAMKGQEEKDMIQSLLLEETVCDGGKGIIAVAETKTENDKSKRVKEIEEQQFQILKGGEVSGRGEVDNVENEKKTTVAEKRIRDSTREAQDIEKNDSDASGKYIEEPTIQELGENRGIYRNENEEEKKDETDRPKKITGTIKQELVSLNSPLEEDNVEEKSQELVEEKIKGCEEEEGSEESKIKTEDNVVRKVQDMKEEELYEPKREHVSKLKELVEEKTGDYEKHEENEIAESEIEAECGSLRKVDGSEEQELHEPKINKERDKTRITGAEEPSGQEKEEKEKKRAELEKELPGRLESHDKRYKTQELVEAGHKDRKEEEQNENMTAEAELETERESSKKVQEIEQQKDEGLKENEIVDKKTKTKDGSLRNVQDDEDPELTKPYKRQKEDMIQELVEMGSNDYRAKLKKQDENVLRSKEDLDEFETHGEQSNIPKLVEEEKLENIAELEGKMEDDSSSKFHEFEERKSNEDWTHEEREKRKDLVKEEATDPKDKHTGGQVHNDHKEEQQEEERVIANAELKTEEDSSKKVREIEKQEYDELQRSKVQEKMQETEEKEKTRAMEENEIVKRRRQTKEGSLGKLREGEDPELGRHERRGEEDRIQELVETEISDHKEKVKKKYEDDILRSQDTRKVDLGERERHSKQRKIHQSVEDRKVEGKMENISETGGKMKGDSSDKFHEFQKQKSYEDYREDYREEEECEEAGNLVKEKATDLKDKHTGGEEEAAHTKIKAEDEINETVGENKEPESEKQKRYEKLDKLVLKEGREKEEGNLFEDFTTKIQETKKEESHELEMREKQQDIVPDFMENETGDQEDEEAEEAAAVVASNENGNSNKVQTIKEHKKQNMIPETSDTEVKETKQDVPNSRNVQETKELEAHFQELEGKTENSKDDDGSKGDKGKQGKTVETMSRERFKKKSEIVRKIQETKVEESNEKKNHERKGKIEEPERKESSNHEVKLASEDDSLRKGQEFLEKESNMSKRGPVEQDKIQEPKEVEKQDRVNEDAEAETKIDDGKSRKFEMCKLLELDESEEPKKKIQKPMEEKSNAPEIEKKGNEKIAEEEMQCRVKDKEVKGQEPYELLKNIEHEKIPEYHREEEKGMEQREIEEMKRAAEDVSSRECQDVEEKGSDQPKRYAEQEKIRELMTEEEGKEEYQLKQGEQNEKAKRILQVESKAHDDSSKKNETEGQETTALRGENHQRKEETIDECDSSRKIHGHEEERKMREKLAEKETSHDDKEAKERNRAGVVWREEEPKVRDDGFRKARETEEKEQDKKQSYEEKDISGKAKENKNQETKRSGNEAQEIEKQESHEQKRSEEEVFRRPETNDEYDSSRKIHEHGGRKSDQLGEKLAEEETSNDKEAKDGNRAGPELGEVEKKFGKVREIEEREQDKKQSLETDISGKEKENKNQETKTRDDSSGKKIQENEQQESHEQKRNEEQDKKNLGLVEKKKEEDETAEAEVPRNLKGIEKRQSTKVVEKHEHRDNIKESKEERMNNHEGEDKKSVITQVLAKAKEDESKVPEGLRKQDKNMEQRLRDDLKDEETKRKDNETRKFHRIKERETCEQEILKEHGRIKELVDDRTHFCIEKENRETELEDGSSKMIQERDKEESIDPERDENKTQEPVDMETSEDDEEELEIEFEDEEEDWEAEVIQETDSNEDNDKIRQIKRIRLGFRLVGGSTFFMSLIVIVISIIRSKRKIRCYKF